ncbi:MAG: hypothetical protein V4640_02345 [Verrucomicrobiota bacterium]
MPAEHRKPLWLLPNLLSLDAPLVAVAWLYMFAKTWRVDYLPWAAYFALGLAVWIIYVTDRLLDASLVGGVSGKLEPRHDFHRRHQKLFRRLLIAAAIAVVVLVVTRLPMTIYGFGIGGGGDINAVPFLGVILVAGFFVLSISSTHGPDEIPHAKNLLAGAAFAYGTSMIAYAFTTFTLWEFIRSRELISFGVLCMLNISAIDLWEHSRRSSDPEIKATDELALTLPLVLLGGAALVFAAQDHDLTTRPFYYAVLTGAALLYILNRNRSRFGMDSLRVLADVALLIPIVVFQASALS